MRLLYLTLTYISYEDLVQLKTVATTTDPYHISHDEVTILNFIFFFLYKLNYINVFLLSEDMSVLCKQQILY